MHTIINILISNAAITALLGFAVWAISKICKKPQVMHALWVLLLAKMLMPTILQIPLNILPEPQAQPETIAYISTDLLNNLSFEPGYAIPKITLTQTPEQTTTTKLWQYCQIYYPHIIVTGSICWLLIGLWRIINTNRKLKTAKPAANFIQLEANEIARQINLNKNIEVVTWDITGSPMVWAFSKKPKIIVPVRLFYSFSQSQQQAVLAHELMHLKRRDHWLRCLEFAVLTLYWWNPVAWWIVRQERQTEEASCDVQVTNHFPNKVKDYARALLQTLEYIANTAKTVPFGGSGLTNSKFLTRRIKMILNHKKQNGISPLTKFVVIVMALAIMPVSVGLAKDKIKDKKAKTSKAIIVTADGQKQVIDLSANDNGKLITIEVDKNGKVHVNDSAAKNKNSSVTTKAFVNGKEIDLDEIKDIDMNAIMKQAEKSGDTESSITVNGKTIKADNIDINIQEIIAQAMNQAKQSGKNAKTSISSKMFVNGKEVNMDKADINKMIAAAMKDSQIASKEAAAAIDEAKIMIKGYMIDSDGNQKELNFDNTNKDDNVKVFSTAKMFVNGKEVDMDTDDIDVDVIVNGKEIAIKHIKEAKERAKAIQEKVTKAQKDTRQMEIKILQQQLKEMQKRLDKLQEQK
ncbi:MAG: M48 family metalloprotease [Phycisphaerae bacterium]|nr:M48 family metalloprotease [Phycisphaerae bacterium]